MWNSEKTQIAPLNRHRPAVLLIGNFLSGRRGARGVCEDLALGFGTAGWSVITTSSHSGRLARLTDFLLTVWRQRSRYEVAQVDVYSGLSFIWAEVVCWVLRRARKPYILTLHGGNLPNFSRNSEQRVRRLLQSASAVTAPSMYLLEQMRCYDENIILLPNPLDLSKYPFNVRQCPAPNLIWLRAFHDIYNPLLAIRVIALVAKNFPSVQMTMIGPDKDDGSLGVARALAKTLGVMDRIAFTGSVPKEATAHWLNQGDIFLNTTKIDNMPVSVLEAMACGLCVVSTSVGGIPYLLEDACEGLLVPADNDAVMAMAVQRCLTEDGLAERLSRNARRKVEQFDWPTILPKWEKLVTDIAERNRT